MHGRTFGNVLDSLASRFPLEPALVDGDLRLNYSDVVGEFRAIGQALRDLGLRPGDSIGIAMKDTADLVLAMYGSMWAGITTVPLNMKLAVADHRYMLTDAGVTTLLYHGATAEHVRQVVDGLSLDHVLTVGTSQSDAPALDLSQYPRDAAAPQDVDPAAPVWIQYTGGTTGMPKGVVHSHNTALTTLLSCALEFDFEPGERHAHVCPLTHSGVAAMLPVWLRGGCNYLLRGFDTERLLRTVAQERITSTILVPTMLGVLLDSPLLGATDISSLRTIVYGASPITPGTLSRALSAFGPILIQSYGQTEVFAQISVLDKADHAAAVENPALLTAAGRSVAVAEVRIGAEDCTEVPVGELGEILVRGPHSFLGYLNKPEETEAAMRGGWLHTGDLGRRDAAGYLHITGRKKDVIISGGFNVYPREVEDVLDTHPLVKECCVVGLPDEKWGEKVTAVLVVDEGVERTALTDEVIALVKRKKGSVNAPKSVVFVDAIPLTSVGKHDKKMLVERLSGELELNGVAVTSDGR